MDDESAMTSSLPSYHDATTRPDWISIVAPYVYPPDYARLCLVARRFYAEFGARLWKDPFKTIRLLGHDPADDTNRLRYFLTTQVGATRLATRCLVLSLDFRDLDLTAYQFFDYQLWNGTGNKQVSSRLASAFPGLRCILLDRAPDWLADAVVADLEKDPESPARLACLMFTAPRAPTILSPAFFQGPNLRSVVYLDVSYNPGSLKMTLLSASLPSLRILKVEGRELDDATSLVLFTNFKKQLWSLDVSHNKLTDTILTPLVLSSFPETSLRTAAHHDVEGRLQWDDNAGCPWYGRFGFVEESDHSSRFTHPARYFADPPMYTHHADVETRDHGNVRHNGRRPVRRDSPESIKRLLIGRPDELPGSQEDVERLEICASHGGITHLRLNGNHLSLRGIERMLRESTGQIEHLECDSTLLEVPSWTSLDSPRRGSTAPKLTGFVGASHLLRPVFCPHLQVLRVHHSLVSQIPGIKEEHVAADERFWVAEAIFEPRVAMAFPQVFAPDMNPRLYSLTLTEVPRYSVGPLIAKILNFLRQASIQERAIQDINAAHSHRESATLRGLRHLHLEFGQDPREATPSALDLEAVDAAKILGVEGEGFSFFGQSGWASSSFLTAKAEVWSDDQEQECRENGCNSSHDETPLFASENPPPYRPGFAETPDRFERHRGVWNGTTFTVPVWVSSGVPGPHPAVNEYVRLLKYSNLHARVGPASPDHVLAGVPAGSHIYHAAWDAILAPPAIRKPTAAELGGMRDVVAAIKEYRGKTRAALTAAQRAAGTMNVPFGAPHYHWSGKLEISFPPASHNLGMWQ